jgi:hypothetical protein
VLLKSVKNKYHLCYSSVLHDDASFPLLVSFSSLEPFNPDAAVAWRATNFGLQTILSTYREITNSIAAADCSCPITACGCAGLKTTIYSASAVGLIILGKVGSLGFQCLLRMYPIPQIIECSHFSRRCQPPPLFLPNTDT